MSDDTHPYDLSLADVLVTAEGNVAQVAKNHPAVFKVLSRLHDAFMALQRCIRHDADETRLLPRFLMTRSHASIVAAIRLACGGSTAEVFPLLRLTIEQAWYALHVASDPHGTRRARLWLCRNDGKEEMGRCKAEFTISNVRATHEARDSETARVLRQLYETMIDYGAHPNQLGLRTGLTTTESDGETTFWIAILNDDELTKVLSLRMVVAVGLGALHAFNQIYPDRFRTAGLRAEMDALGEEFTAVFQPFVQQGSEQP